MVSFLDQVRGRPAGSEPVPETEDFFEEMTRHRASLGAPDATDVRGYRRRARLHLALACSEPPQGLARWSLRLLADKLVELEISDAVSYQTVGRILKKTNSSRS